VSSLGISRWDPFELQPPQFKKALLDEGKIGKLRTLIRLARSKLPIAKDWASFSQKHSFDAQSIHSLINESFYSDAAAFPSPAGITTADFGCGILERSYYLQSRNLRAAKLAKLVGCAVTCIAEHIDGGFKHGAGIVWLLFIFSRLI
jgi:hypothetical protein